MTIPRIMVKKTQRKIVGITGLPIDLMILHPPLELLSLALHLIDMIITYSTFNIYKNTS